MRHIVSQRVHVFDSATCDRAGALDAAECSRREMRRRAMTEIMARDTQGVTEAPEEFFTGRATIRGLFSRDEPSRVTGAIVTFQPGARTAWHSHPLGQTLIVLDGVGWTQVEDGPVQEFTAGDILLCPRDRRHWH